LEPFLFPPFEKTKRRRIIQYRYIAVEVFFILGISLAGNLSLTQSVWAERLVNSTAETRLVVGLRVGQAELQKLVPTPFQITPIPGGPLKEANFFVAFIDAFLLHDAQGKPDIGGINRYVVFSAKHSQIGEMVTVVIGGLSANIGYVPGPYKTNVSATIRREQTHKGANLEFGVGTDFWEEQGSSGGIIELRLQYQGALPTRAKLEQKFYSAVEPSFFRIYRLDMASIVVKSIPAGIDRVQKYQFRVAVPELSKLFDGTEQFVAVTVIPLCVRQIFLP